MNQYLNQLIAAESFIKNNNNFLIVSHVQPDGDTISSSLALAQIMKKLGKEYCIVNQNKVPVKLSFLLEDEVIYPIDEVSKQFSAVVTIDVADIKRAGEINQLLKADAKILNIDHHPTNDNFGKYNLVLSTAAATAEIIYDLAKQMEIPFNLRLASLVYTGLLSDTGGFRYSNTTSKVMGIAAEMLSYEINPSEIAEIALESITLGYIEILKLALANIEIIENGLIAWTSLGYNEMLNSSLSFDDTEGVVSITRNIEGVEVGVVFKEIEQEQYRISLRSKKLIDVGKIAKDYQGGGHARAAGFSYCGSLNLLQRDLLDKIKQSKGWKDIGG